MPCEPKAICFFKATSLCSYASISFCTAIAFCSDDSFCFCFNPFKRSSSPATVARDLPSSFNPLFSTTVLFAALSFADAIPSPAASTFPPSSSISPPNPISCLNVFHSVLTVFKQRSNAVITLL